MARTTRLSMRQPNTMGLIVQTGTVCWAPHGSEAFVEGVIDGVLPSGNVRVRLTRRTERDQRQQQFIECSPGQLQPRIADRSCVANMDDLPELNMAEVLANVTELYGRRQPSSPYEAGGWSSIYSSVGPVLIAMNPFEELPLYGVEWIRAYREAGLRGCFSHEWIALGPHCFGTIEQAYQGLRTQPHQSVIICGESGAGKTVTNRKMLEYLLDAEYLGTAGVSPSPTSGRERTTSDVSPANRRGSGRLSSTSVLSKVDLSSFSSAPPPPPALTHRKSSAACYDQEKQMIAGANELLEAFGNAQTLRNDNSSRFGKYSQLHFDGEALEIRGFEIEHYLLERSRVTSLPFGERNYHIFYLLLDARCSADYELEGGPEAFAYTRGSAAKGFSSASGSSGAGGAGGFLCGQENAFEAVRNRMETAGLSAEDRGLVFEAIAAVLHLGNADFEEVGGQARLTASSAEPMRRACRLLGLQAEGSGGLGPALGVLRTSRFPKNLSVTAARAQRDAVAKMIYSRLFDWIIGRLNEKLMKWRGSKRATVGLLDIFGFEDMPVNGLEQLFINLTNERIQYIFNNVMFEREQDAYLKEGIETTFSRPSNLPCIDLFVSKANPVGLVRLLADQCKTVGQDGEKEKRQKETAFVSSCNKEFRDHGHFTRVDAALVMRILAAKREKWKDKAPKDLSYELCFQVHHYAEKVTYSAQDFVTKSNDTLPQHLVELIQSSSKPGVRDLFSEHTEATKSTVGEKFVKQLEVLANKLDNGASLFVRCIKPNASSPPIPRKVDGPLVLEQLVCGGVVAALEMRRIGYPDRMEYRQFCDEFWILELGWRKVTTTWQDDRRYCEAILQRFVLDEEQYALGHSKVFMRSGVLSRMRATVSFRTLRFVIVVQRKWRFLKGTQLLHSVEEARLRFEALCEEAQDRGLADCGPVASSSKRAQDVLDRVLKRLEESEELHATDSPRTSRHKVAREVVKYCGQDIPRLRQLVVEVSEALQRVIDRQARAEQMLAARLHEARQEAGALLQALEPCEAECGDGKDGAAAAAAEVAAEEAAEEDRAAAAAEVDEAEEAACAACREACRAARSRLDDLLRRDLPEIEAEGPAGLDLSRDYAAADPAPRAAELLAEAGALVAQAEGAACALRATRVTFEDSVAAEQRTRMETQARLEALQASAQWAMDEGISAVQDSLDAAWRLLNCAESQFRRFKDKAAFVRAVEDFEAAVKAAESELRRAEQERRVRQQQQQEQQHLQLQPAPQQQQERRRDLAPPPPVDRARRRELLAALNPLPRGDLQNVGGAFLLALEEAIRDLETRPTAEAISLGSELRQMEESIRGLGISEQDCGAAAGHGDEVRRGASGLSSFTNRSWRPSSSVIGQQRQPQWRGVCLLPWRRRQQG